MRRQFRSSSKRAIFPETDVCDLCRKTVKQKSPSSSGLGDHRSGQAKPQAVHIGGRVRRPPKTLPCKLLFAWERLEKEVRLLNSMLNRRESTGRLIRYVLITRRSLVQIQPLQPSPHDYSSPSPLGLITRIGRSPCASVHSQRRFS